MRRREINHDKCSRLSDKLLRRQSETDQTVLAARWHWLARGSGGDPANSMTARQVIRQPLSLLSNAGRLFIPMLGTGRAALARGPPRIQTLPPSGSTAIVPWIPHV